MSHCLVFSIAVHLEVVVSFASWNDGRWQRVAAEIVSNKPFVERGEDEVDAGDNDGDHRGGDSHSMLEDQQHGAEQEEGDASTQEGEVKWTICVQPGWCIHGEPNDAGGKGEEVEREQEAHEVVDLREQHQGADQHHETDQHVGGDEEFVLMLACLVEELDVVLVFHVLVFVVHG